ncbi:RhuM family protein [Psychrobacter sp. 4Bb]|uniref:RhuM family protein n=1 Tax=Psychrobacter sp. 4Bb TaxID=888436 RepID=UPI000C7A0155|nr:hypothetical protein CXF60_02980 [Psychrobacter sp. 4Bb]
MFSSDAVISDIYRDGDSKLYLRQHKHIANSDRPVTFYDLDVVISVGYRIKSPQGVQFRR